MMAKSGTAKRPKGGQSKYSVAKGERICGRLEEGKGLRKAVEGEGVGISTVVGWARKDGAFGERYARACEARLSYLEERLLELCAEGHEAALDERCGTARLHAIKLEIDTIKWLLCKLRPRKYGEKQAVEVSGGDNPVGVEARLSVNKVQIGLLLEQIKRVNAEIEEEDGGEV